MHSKFTRFYLAIFTFLLAGLIFTSCEETIEPETFGSIRGRVTYAATGEPVAGASITTNPATEAILTDADGTFYLPSVPTGNVTVNIKKADYKTESPAVMVKEGQTTQVISVLSPTDGSSANSAPAIPAGATPENGAADVSTNLQLKWFPATDPDGDSLRYDILLYESDSTKGRLVAENVFDTTYTLEGLRHNTAYYWQIIAKDSSDHLTPGPVWSFKTVSFPDNRFLFSRNMGANYEIFSADLSDGSTQRLTGLPSREWRPLQSPLQDLIAFTSNADVETQIYTMSREGKEVYQVTTLPVAGYHNNGLGYTWSPDGGEFLYSHYDMLYKINRAGFNLRPVAQAPAGYHWRDVDWTAQNGGKIAALAIGPNIYDSRIYLMNADGSDTVQIVSNEPGMLGGPVFSIDGTKILFTKDVSGFESVAGDGRQLDSHIFLLNLINGELTDLSGNKEDGTNDLMPRFSPDGAKVVFVNTSNEGTGSPDIYIMNTSGSERELLLEDGVTPSWE
ncbi:carboxypeptidase regulatory-like domain-containing protein [Nafulsella turpanensis]|uniref:carboxypeptidase regulatory-like domain-containing protein n=1 Tax=Nafulsella turpanensis TaxID=1265690 RepID=UPI000345836C|nr:carboxypeptidase regulatory-like domain-containing protein [Nafulsella turpanensis]